MADRLVNNSEIQVLKQCRRRWYLGYHRGLRLRDEPEVGAAPLGTLVHHALEAYYAGGQSSAAMLAALDERRPAEDDREAFRQWELANTMVTGYREWLEETGADANLKVVATERQATVPFQEIHGRQVFLTGRLDLEVLDEATGQHLFMDHKTVGTLEDELLPSEQLLMYHLIRYLEVLAEDPQAEPPLSGGILNKLRKVGRTARANPPFYAREEVFHTKTQLRRFWQRLAVEIADLLELEDKVQKFGSDVCYPTPSRDCRWRCDFVAPCVMMDNGDDWRGLLDALYVEGPTPSRSAVREDLPAHERSAAVDMP